MTENAANLVEIFSSVQGEGPYVGYMQMFVRFADCNLNCKYCDTEFRKTDRVNIEKTPGSSEFEMISNPVEAETIFYYLKQLDEPGKVHHSISLTGGEPLLQADFLKTFLTENFTRYKFKTYLETNGTLCEELEKVVKLLDIVSMDIKLPSATGNTVEHWHEHKQFLEILKENKSSKVEYFVKVVVNEHFTNEELYNIVWCMASSESEATLILQPETKKPPGGKQLLEWQSKLIRYLNNVRIIPQTHRVLNVH